MNKYIWINPVAEKMLEKDIDLVKKQLVEKRYEIAICEPQLDYVRNQYVEFSEKNEGIVLDCRCPEAVELLKRNNTAEKFDIPDIEPILIRTSRVLYDKYVNSDDDILIVTCPCTQLRDHAISVFEGIPNIKFYTWKEFRIDEDITPEVKFDHSPIPLGFFRESFGEESVIELSDEKEILKGVDEILKSPDQKIKIVEMLYCKDGCNNGNGI
ncbi:MAG: hypothetical protein LBN09_05755 [Clostridioides sp.]|jgi:hypothetical protein|nr:hypothetical protein [Clostridioides sp.]